jgi:hypothetical protein
MVTKIVFYKKFFRKSKLDIYFCPFFKFQKTFVNFISFFVKLEIATFTLAFLLAFISILEYAQIFRFYKRNTHIINRAIYTNYNFWRFSAQNY